MRENKRLSGIAVIFKCNKSTVIVVASYDLFIVTVCRQFIRIRYFVYTCLQVDPLFLLFISLHISPVTVTRIRNVILLNNLI